MAMQRYRFNLAANGHVLFMVQGSKFIVKESRGPVNIRVLQDGGFLNGLEAGQGFKGRQFAGIEITDASGLANDGYVIVSDDEFVDNRVTGEVSVIDGEKSRSIAGGRFHATADLTSPGEYPGIQLNNPADSGKNLIITGIDAGLSAAGSVRVYGGDTEYATDVTNSSVSNAYVGASVGVAEVRREAFAAPPTVPYGRGREPIIPANSCIQLLLNGPIVVPPGKSLDLLAAPVGVTLVATFQWFEEDI